MELTSLSHLRPGDKGTVQTINGTGLFFTRLRTLGLCENSHVELLREAPFGGPLQIQLSGKNSIAVPRQEAGHILLRRV
ncbi:MAG: ferrous iron transport protein A [Deltaproteobacteria bacterium]|nr:ferrous iron transport protein A [Deltaproteobacteria bacterium]